MAMQQYRFELKVTGYVKTEHFSMARIERAIEQALNGMGIPQTFITNVSYAKVEEVKGGDIS